MNYYIDLDATLFPLAQAMKKHPSYKNLNPKKIVTWEYLIEYTNPEVFLDALRIAFTQNQNLKPIPKSRECIEYLRLLAQLEPGEIIILTNRNEIYHNESQEWLDRHNIYYDRLEVIGSDNSKIDYIISDTTKESIIIDDAPHILAEAKQHPLIHPLGLQYPYNQEHHDILQKSWPLILDKIISLQQIHIKL